MEASYYDFDDNSMPDASYSDFPDSMPDPVSPSFVTPDAYADQIAFESSMNPAPLESQYADQIAFESGLNPAPVKVQTQQGFFGNLFEKSSTLLVNEGIKKLFGTDVKPGVTATAPKSFFNNSLPERGYGGLTPSDYWNNTVSDSKTWLILAVVGFVGVLFLVTIGKR